VLWKKSELALLIIERHVVKLSGILHSSVVVIFVSVSFFLRMS
jgi:hypothetical protein